MSNVTTFEIDGKLYHYDVPTREEVEAFHKVRLYHNVERVLEELEWRYEQGQVHVLPGMSAVMDLAQELSEFESEDWHSGTVWRECVSRVARKFCDN